MSLRDKPRPAHSKCMTRSSRPVAAVDDAVRCQPISFSLGVHRPPLQQSCQSWRPLRTLCIVLLLARRACLRYNGGHEKVHRRLPCLGVSIGAGVLCNPARKSDSHHCEDQYQSVHALCAGHDLFNAWHEWHNGRTTLGSASAKSSARQVRLRQAAYANATPKTFASGAARQTGLHGSYGMWQAERTITLLLDGSLIGTLPSRLSSRW
jgi:hypothetical protein